MAGSTSPASAALRRSFSRNSPVEWARPANTLTAYSHSAPASSKVLFRSVIEPSGTKVYHAYPGDIRLWRLRGLYLRRIIRRDYGQRWILEFSAGPWRGSWHRHAVRSEDRRGYPPAHQ